MKNLVGTLLVFLLLVSAFNIGRYSERISGSTIDWITLIFSITTPLLIFAVLLYGARKSR